VGTERYFNGLAVCENWVPMVSGGVRVRGGLKYAGAAKYPDKKTYLIPFIFSHLVVYMLEVGHLYIRIWKYDTAGEPVPVLLAGNPVEIVTTYTEDEAGGLDAKQSADVLFIDHANHPPAMLSRLSETNWVLSDVGFVPPPLYEPKTELAASLTASAATGFGVTFTATAVVFLPADVGREIGNADAGSASITGYIDANHVVGDITSGTFLTGGNYYAAGDWWLRGSPNAVLRVPSAPPAGGSLTVSLWTDAAGTVATSGFRPEDVGKYLIVLEGVLKIYQFLNAQSVNARVVTPMTRFPLPQQIAVIDQTTLTVTLKIPTPLAEFVTGGLWTMEVPTWTAARGYPTVLTLGQQRVFHGGAAGEPDTIRATPTGDYFGFNPGITDDRALSFTIASEEINILQWLTFWNGLAVGTLGGGFLVSGASGGISPLTPKSVLVRPAANVGSERMDAVRVGPSLLYVERGGRKARELRFDVSTDGFIPKDLSAWADHIAETYKFRGLVYQQALYPIVWFARCDGAFVSLTYEREHKVEGWARHSTWTGAGMSFVLSMGVIPNAAKAADDLWMVVTRVVNGATVNYIEVLDWDRFLDASVAYSGAATGTIAGLSHLEGESVFIRGRTADGILRLYPVQTVTGGQVTGLTPAVTSAEVGVYRAATATPMRLEMPAGETLQGRRKGFGNITLRLKDTPTLTWGGIRYKRNRGDAVVSGYAPNAVFTVPTGADAIAGNYVDPLGRAVTDRDVELLQTDFDTSGRVSIVQDLPLGGWLLMWTADVAVGK